VAVAHARIAAHRRALVLAAAVLLALWPRLAFAHPVPFSFLDLRLSDGRIDATLVVHIFDAAHELGIEPVEKLLDPAVASAQAARLAAILGARLTVVAGDTTLAPSAWSAPEILSERQSWKFTFTYSLSRPPATIGVRGALFPYDPQHQTFINVYDQGALALQAIVDARHPSCEYFTGTTPGIVAVIRRFVPAGIHHILIGPDHLLFLIGLLLLGGSARRLLLVVTAFTVAHSLTLSLAVLNIVSPPSRLIEPAIALSIVYVGVDNLMSRAGRDVRAWIAGAFGLIHGFGFASVLREMNLPRRALGWSLLSFNVGVELGQLAVVVVAASAIAVVRSRNERAGRRLVTVGSTVVMAAGAYWFIERVFFPGG
jgi:hydrogenase/urease accessory protein HupE